jgi:hypothetical protein
MIQYSIFYIKLKKHIFNVKYIILKKEKHIVGYFKSNVRVYINIHIQDSKLICFVK